MAFKNRNMTVIAYANGFTLWQYRTMDSIKLLDEDIHYFAEISTLMKTGDIIIINAGDITAMRCIANLKGDVVELGPLQ